MSTDVANFRHVLLLRRWPCSRHLSPFRSPLYPNVIPLLSRKLFMHLCQCFLCYFLPWDKLTAYVMLCYYWVYSCKVPMKDAFFSAFYLLASCSLDFICVFCSWC